MMRRIHPLSIWRQHWLPIGSGVSLILLGWLVVGCVYSMQCRMTYLRPAPSGQIRVAGIGVRRGQVAMDYIRWDDPPMSLQTSVKPGFALHWNSQLAWPRHHFWWDSRFMTWPGNPQATGFTVWFPSWSLWIFCLLMPSIWLRRRRRHHRAELRGFAVVGSP